MITAFNIPTDKFGWATKGYCTPLGGLDFQATQGWYLFEAMGMCFDTSVINGNLSQNVICKARQFVTGFII